MALWSTALQRSISGAHFFSNSSRPAAKGWNWWNWPTLRMYIAVGYKIPVVSWLACRLHSWFSSPLLSCHAPPAASLLSADLAVEVFILHETFDAHVGFTIGAEHLLASLLVDWIYARPSPQCAGISKAKLSHLRGDQVEPSPNQSLEGIYSLNDVFQVWFEREKNQTRKNTNFSHHPVTLRDGIFQFEGRLLVAEGVTSHLQPKSSGYWATAFFRIFFSYQQRWGASRHVIAARNCTETGIFLRFNKNFGGMHMIANSAGLWIYNCKFHWTHFGREDLYLPLPGIKLSNWTKG